MLELPTKGESMKKILLSVFIGLFLFNFTTCPTQAKEPTLITFIYINGSNDYNYKNRLKFKEHFEEQVKKMHPVMIQGFEEDDFAQKNFLKDGEYRINPEPKVFYWGDRSLSEIENIDNDLNASNSYTPKIAQTVRGVFAHCLHDAIWVQKYQNMSLVIDDLQKIVNEETKKGHKVVLFGYSAGSFITYQYFLNKFTSIKPWEMDDGSNETITKVIKSHPAKPTCIDALMETDLVKLHASGEFYVNPDIDIFVKNYPKLDKQTQMSCFKDDEVKGVVNFASPLILFYSNIADSHTSLNFLSQLMVKNIVENDIFFLTVNYRNDPLGFPNAENLTVSDLKNSKSILAKYLKPNNGFIYNKSDIYVPRTFISAHLAYWDTPKIFVKGIVDAYNDGYKYFYEISE